MDAVNIYPSNNDTVTTICKDLIRDNEISNEIFSRASDRTQEASSSAPAYKLGPAFAGPISEKIIPHFPYNISVRPIYQRKNTESARFDWGIWNEGITISTWYHSSSDQHLTPLWRKWVGRMEKCCSEKWEMLGIKEAILMSKSSITLHEGLFAAALLFWSPSINAFVFPEGFMTPTIEDVFALVGLPPDGMDCHPDMFKDYMRSNPSCLYAFGGDDVNSYPSFSCCQYGTVINEYCNSKESVPVEIEEEISFYHVWICRILTCTVSKKNVKHFFCIAQCLVNGRKVALAPFFLGEVYNAMFRYCQAPSSGLGGPVWFIQIWLYAYFSSLAPSPKIFPEPITYGQMWMEGRYQDKIPTFDECFDVFSRISKEEGPQSLSPKRRDPQPLWPKRRDPQSFRPFSERKYGPREFREFDSLEPSASILASYLVARDLLVIRYKIYFFEAYTPVFASRQLGFIQAIPLPPFWTANDPWHTRERFTAKTLREKMELGNSKMKNFNPVPYKVVCDATQNFDSWYGSYIIGYNMPGDLSDALNAWHPNFIIRSAVSGCDELEKEDANKVSPAKITYSRKRNKPIDVVSAIPINKKKKKKEQSDKKKNKKNKKKKKETEEELIHEAAKQVEEEIHEAAKQVVEEIHEAAMGRKTDKVFKEWEREQNVQIVASEKISSDESKKTTEGAFKSIETEMRNSRKKSRAKKRNLPRMIAAKKSSKPQIASNSEGRNNSEESDELESSFEPNTEREEERCEEEDEYISTEVGMEVEDPSSEVMETDGLESSFEPYTEREEECEETIPTTTPATSLVSEIPTLQLFENVDKMIKRWDNIVEISASASKINESEEETQGKGNEEKEDEAEDYNKKREDEERGRDVETIPTTTPAAGLVSEVPTLQLIENVDKMIIENVDKMIKNWDNIVESSASVRSASASTSAISSDQLMRSFRSLQEILSLPFTQVINNSRTKEDFVSLCNLLLPCMVNKDRNKWFLLQQFSKGFDTATSKFSTAEANLEQVKQLLEDHKVKFPNADKFNCQLKAAKLKQAEDSQVEEQTAQKIRDLKNQLDIATKKKVDTREYVEELFSQEKSITEGFETWSKSQAEIWTLRKEATSITESANLEWEEFKKVFQDIDFGSV